LIDFLLGNSVLKGTDQEKAAAGEAGVRAMTQPENSSRGQPERAHQGTKTALSAFRNRGK
jgi:hypothetical protein